MQHLLYRSLTAALALTGCASLIITGELIPAFVIPGLAILPGYYRYLSGRPPVSRWLVAGLAVAEIFVLAFDAVYVSRDFLVAIAHMTIVFQALKSFDLREPWDPLQVYFMALLQLIITSDLGLSMAVGSAFVVFLFLFMAVLVVSHFMKEGTIDKVSIRRPVVLISLAAFVFTAVFFVSVPRVKSGIWGRRAAGGIKTVGFSGAVDFGSFGEVLDDDTIVMRVDIKGGKEVSLYWRGSTLDRFDGVTWKDTVGHRELVSRRVGIFYIRPGYWGRLGELVEQEVILEPLDTDVVFGLGEIAAVKSKSWLVYRNMAGTVFLPQKNRRRYSYTVYSLPEPGKELFFRSHRVQNKYLQMPKGLERIVGLAKSVAGDASGAGEIALGIQRYLLRNFEYSLETAPPPPGVNAMEDFLFNARKGFCQYFASAMTLMLRSMGIPSRIVTGYKGGEVNVVGSYVIVRQNNAHSWVEALVDGRWQRYDPTPIALIPASSGFKLTLDTLRMKWYRYVIGFSSMDQQRIMRSFTAPVFRLPDIGGLRVSINPLFGLAVFASIVAVFYLIGVRRGDIRPRSFESRAYVRFRSRVRKLGGDVSGSTTPQEVLLEAASLGLDHDKTAALLGMYERARFGGRSLSYEERSECRRLLRELSRSPSRISR
jgi:transglutaminase-like putative cysteine protease